MAEEGLLGAGGSSFDRQDLEDHGEYMNAGCATHAVRTLKKPHVILRFISLIFCIIVSASISGHAWSSTGVCKFNSGSGACNYATTVGVLACCGLVLFLVVDLLFDVLHDVLLRRLIVIADMFFFGLFAFVWFTCFCYLADAWRKTASQDVTVGGSSMQASIAFSFFNIGSFAALAAIAYVRYSDGITDDFTFGFISSQPVISSHPTTTQSTYSSLPSSSGPIQPSPYTSTPAGGHLQPWMPHPAAPTSRAQSTYTPLPTGSTNGTGLLSGEFMSSETGGGRTNQSNDPISASSLLGGTKNQKYDSGYRGLLPGEPAAAAGKDLDASQLIATDDGYQR